MSLEELRKQWSNCTACGLCEERTHVVFGEGNPNADILIIGEAPGEQEDSSGMPFYGPSGTVLDEFLRAVALDREEDCFVTNVVGCRPTTPGVDPRTREPRVDNRQPSKVERDACRPRLLEIIYQVDPLVIMTVGKVPYQALLGKSPNMGSTRGIIQTCRIPGRTLPLRYAVLPIYHTAFLLRTHDKRKEGPWGKTADDFVKLVNAVDHLRERYYGIERPNRQEMINDRAG